MVLDPKKGFFLKYNIPITFRRVFEKLVFPLDSVEYHLKELAEFTEHGSSGLKSVSKKLAVSTFSCIALG